MGTEDTVPIVCGGSVGALSLALMLSTTHDVTLIHHDEYCYESNKGDTRGLRIVNLSEDMIDVLIDGLKFYVDVGIQNLFMTSHILHAFPKACVDFQAHHFYFANEKQKDLLKVLLTRLGHGDYTQPYEIMGTSKDGTYVYVKENTGGVYDYKGLCAQLMDRVKMNKNILYVNEKIIKLEKVANNEEVTRVVTDKYTRDASHVYLALGNGILDVDMKEYKCKSPVPIFNEFSYYTLSRNLDFNSLWAWQENGTQLGYYVMMEKSNVLKVASDTSFVKYNQISKDNLIGYRNVKDNFVYNLLNIDPNDVLSISFSPCYYSVCDFIQQKSNVSILHAAGYGYLVPGWCKRMIQGCLTDTVCKCQLYENVYEKDHHEYPHFNCKL